jgi:hypothetical protein
MRRLTVLAFSVAIAATCAANDLEKYAVWVTGDVINDKKDGLMFRADKPVAGNTIGNLVFLAVTEETAKVLAPMYYKAAEKHMKLRLHGAFLPSSRAKSQTAPALTFSPVSFTCRRIRTTCPPVRRSSSAPIRRCLATRLFRGNHDRFNP